MSTIVDLHRKAFGRPIVVFGGGPSAPEWWTRLKHLDPLVIAANGHSAKLGVQPDYIVCKDDRHSETKEPMEPALRLIGAPILSPHVWADYRMEKWPTQGNSGQLAIAVAAFMGGCPILPIGMDCYQNGGYFHDLAARTVSHGRLESLWSSGITRLMRRLDGAVIRAVNRPLSATFRRYDPDEVLPEPKIPVVFDRLLTST